MDWIDSKFEEPELGVELYFQDKEGNIERGTLDEIEAIEFPYVKWTYIEVVY